MLKRGMVMAAVVAVCGGMVAAAWAQTTTAPAAAEKADVVKMFGARGATPGYYAWPDCTSPIATIDGFRENFSAPARYKIWLHQKPPGSVNWFGDYVPEGEFKMSGEGGETIRLFSILSSKTFVAKGSDVIDGVPQKLTPERIATMTMAAAMPVTTPDGSAMAFVRCAGSAQALLGGAWRSSF